LGCQTQLNQQLFDGATRLGDGSAMIHDSCRLAIDPKKEAGLSAEISMTPPIDDNARDIAACVKTAAGYTSTGAALSAAHDECDGPGLPRTSEAGL
jgi:hypothetical protein